MLNARNKMLIRLLFIALLSTHLRAAASEELAYEDIYDKFYREDTPCNSSGQQCCDDWTYVDHVEGRWLDNHQGYTSFGLFLTLPKFSTPQSLLFLDFREHLFNNGRSAGNFGGGARFIDKSTIYGINAFFDYRNASWNHHFYQLGSGLEIFNSWCDLRFNMYFPIGQRYAKSRNHHFDLGDGFQCTCSQRRQSMWGYDAEVGRWLKRMGPSDWFDLYAAIGFYSYQPNKHRGNFYGGEARLASRIGRYLSIEVRGGYDKVLRTMVQGRISLAIPFETLISLGKGFKRDKSYGSRDVVCQPIHRQEIIALSEKECCWAWNWDGPCTSCSQ
jgi:hypothetical protein